MPVTAPTKRRGQGSARGRKAKAPTTAALARRVAKLERSQEFKYVDTQTSTTISTAGLRTHVNNIGVGDLNSNRDGSKVMMRSFRTKGEVIINPSALNSTLRFTLVYWKGQTGVAPAFTDVFETVDINALPRVQSRMNYKIIRDFRIDLTQGGEERKAIDLYFKMSNVTIFKTASTGGAVADTEQGGLYVFLVSNEATNTPTVLFNHRLGFTDS